VKTGTTDNVRRVLCASISPLSLDDIMKAMPEETDRATVSSLLSQRRAAGEVMVHNVDRKPCWGIDPTFRRQGAKSARLASPTAAPTTSVSPPAPSSAHDAPTGPAPVATQSPAPKAPAAATPRAEQRAAAPETSRAPAVADHVEQLAGDLGRVVIELSGENDYADTLRTIIGCHALANRLAGLLAARSAA
jgi:hypothetical protein